MSRSVLKLAKRPIRLFLTSFRLGADLRRIRTSKWPCMKLKMLFRCTSDYIGYAWFGTIWPKTARIDREPKLFSSGSLEFYKYYCERPKYCQKWDPNPGPHTKTRTLSLLFGEGYSWVWRLRPLGHPDKCFWHGANYDGNCNLNKSMSSCQNIVRSGIQTHALTRGPEHTPSTSGKDILVWRFGPLGHPDNSCSCSPYYYENCTLHSLMSSGKILSEVGFEPTPSDEDQNTLPFL